MRIAAVGDIHGHEHLEALRGDLELLDPPDLFLLAGDLTDHDRVEEFVEVVDAIRRTVRCPLYGVFGNNEYAQSHESYRSRSGIPLLDDEVATVRVAGKEVRLVGSTGSLDRPTWWQRTNVPAISHTYDERVAKIDRLLDGGGFRVLLTHYPPTHATMGAEKEEWRPDLVIHGHIHKGIPFARLSVGQRTIEDFDARGPIPVYNVAYPVAKKITVVDVALATFL